MSCRASIYFFFFPEAHPPSLNKSPSSSLLPSLQNPGSSGDTLRCAGVTPPGPSCLRRYHPARRGTHRPSPPPTLLPLLRGAAPAGNCVRVCCLLLSGRHALFSDGCGLSLTPHSSLSLPPSGTWVGPRPPPDRRLGLSIGEAATQLPLSCEPLQRRLLPDRALNTFSSACFPSLVYS